MFKRTRQVDKVRGNASLPASPTAQLLFLPGQCEVNKNNASTVQKGPYLH